MDYDNKPYVLFNSLLKVTTQLRRLVLNDSLCNTRTGFSLILGCDLALKSLHVTWISPTCLPELIRLTSLEELVIDDPEGTDPLEDLTATDLRSIKLISGSNAFPDWPLVQSPTLRGIELWGDSSHPNLRIHPAMASVKLNLGTLNAEVLDINLRLFPALRYFYCCIFSYVVEVSRSYAALYQSHDLPCCLAP